MAVPLGIATTGFAPIDSPGPPEVPPRAEPDSGSPAPAPARLAPPGPPPDRRAPHGKVPAEVARRAKPHGRPVPALAGTFGPGTRAVPGIDARHGILPAPMTLPEALSRACGLFAGATGRALWTTLPGARLPAHAEAGTAEVSGTQRPFSVR